MDLVICNFRKYLSGFLPRIKASYLFVILAELLTIIIALFLPYKSLFLLIILLTLFIVILPKYKIGLYLLAIFVPLESQRIILNTTSKTVGNEFSYYILIVFITFISYLLFKCFAPEAKNKEQLIDRPINFIVVLLVLWSIFSLQWSPNFYHGCIQETKFLVNIILFYILTVSIDKKETYMTLINILVITAVVLSCAAIISLFVVVEEPFTVNLYNHTYLTLSFFTYPHRAMGFVPHNGLSNSLNIIIGLTFGLFLISRKKKIFYLAVLLLLVTAQLLTRSRGGLFGFLGMSMFLLISISSLRKHFFRNLMLFLAIFLFLFVAVNLENFLFGVERYSTSLAEKTLSQRIGWWESGLKFVFQKTSGVGMGAGGFKYYLGSAEIPHAHSIYLSYLFDFGVIGFTLFFIFLFAVVVKVYSTLSTHNNTPMKIMLYSCMGGAVATAIHLLVDGEYATGMPWLLLGILMATWNLFKKESIESNL